MRIDLKVLAGLVLASVVAGPAFAADAPAEAPAKTSSKKHVRHRKAARPTMQSQIEQLRTDLVGQKTQIDALQQQLSSRDAQLQQVQQQSQAALQQATQQAQEAVAAQTAINTQNQTAVSSLQSSVTDLKGNTASLATTIQTDQAATKKAIESPDSLHYKGITFAPTGSFIDFDTVNRTRATASDIPTPFNAIPFSASDAGKLSEFFTSSRQSRIALLAQGKVGQTALAAYYEADWLGTGVTSNNNQSSSYVFRQRQLWAQANFHSGLTLTGGAQWTLATEDGHAIDNRTEVLPQTIDPNYQVGFVWARQPGLRATYRFSPLATVGFSAEQAQTLTPVCAASTGAFCAINYLAGAPGTLGGLYNGGGVPAGTSVGGTTGITTAPTDVADGALATYSYNLAPDLLAKVALDPKNAHIEMFGIARFFRNRVYPNVSPQTGKLVNATLAGGAGAYNNTEIGGGVGGSARLFAFAKKLDFGVKGQYGDGTSRYATTQLADLTVRPNGQFALIHNFSAMGFTDYNVTPRLAVFAYYGTDYDLKSVFRVGTGQAGYGSHLLATSGCGTEPAPGTTTGGSASTGAVNGFSPTVAANCAPQTKDTREGTAGYWYDFYRGPVGRFRQGFQYSWVERNTYTGLNNITPTAIDNVIETSMRYYLP